MKVIKEITKSVPAGVLKYTLNEIDVPHTVLVIQSITYAITGRYEVLSTRYFNPTKRYPTLEDNIKRAISYYKLNEK